MRKFRPESLVHDVNIARGESRFFGHTTIDRDCTELFTMLASERHLCGLPLDRFVERVAVFAIALDENEVGDGFDAHQADLDTVEVFVKDHGDGLAFHLPDNVANEIRPALHLERSLAHKYKIKVYWKGVYITNPDAFH